MATLIVSWAQAITWSKWIAIIVFQLQFYQRVFLLEMYALNKTPGYNPNQNKWIFEANSIWKCPPQMSYFVFRILYVNWTPPYTAVIQSKHTFVGNVANTFVLNYQKIYCTSILIHAS